MTQTYKVNPIGIIDRNHDSKDQYLEIVCPDDDIDLDQAHDYLLSRSFYDTDRPGAWFCYRVSVLPTGVVNRAIGIVHHELNV